MVAPVKGDTISLYLAGGEFNYHGIHFVIDVELDYNICVIALLPLGVRLVFCEEPKDSARVVPCFHQSEL
jgi:hypothetical protein